MHSNADTDGGGHDGGRWSAAAIKAIVAELARQYPQETEERIEQIVQFCKGAVFPAEGRERLIRFAAGLLMAVPAKSTESKRRGR